MPAAPAPPPDPTRPVDVLTVTSVLDVTPSVRRIVLAGTPAAAAAAGPTISLLVPRVGDPAPRWPTVQRDGRIVWPEGAHGVSLRSYTARRQDAGTGEVEIDFVLHGDDRRRGRSARRDRDRGARTAQSRREPRDERDRAYMGGGMVDTGGATASPRPGFNMAPSIAGGGGPFETQPPIGSLSPTPMPLR